MGPSIQPQTGTPAALQVAAARRRGPVLPPIRGAAPVDPYAAILASLPKPLAGPQITRQATAEISPLIAAVTGQIGKQTQAATHAIGGFTADAASKLAAIDFAAPYAQGEQGQAAVDAALRDSLAGAGQHGADELAQRLGVINDPTVGAAAHALAANGVANGATQVAQGSASLGNLIANAASAGEYGLKQPGITRLAGLQNIAAAGQQGQAQIAAKAAELEAQLPAIIQNLQSRNDSRSQAISAVRQNQVARQDALEAGSAATSTKLALADANNQTKYALADASNKTRLEVAALNAQGRATSQQATQARSDRAYRLQFSKTFGYDPITGTTLPGFTRGANGQVTKVGSSKPGSGGSSLTPHEISTMVGQWHDGKVQNARVPAAGADGGSVYEANGAQVYTTKSGTAGQLTYPQALKRLVAAKVDQQTALNYLNSAWKRGEGGRAWLMNPEQDVLRHAGLPPRAKVINGHAVLDAHQVAALRKADHLPPGQETAEGAYVIAQVY